MKVLRYILFILGVLLIFSGDALGEYGPYFRILGIAILMYTLYTISSKLTSKERKNTDSDNLRL